MRGMVCTVWSIEGIEVLVHDRGGMYSGVTDGLRAGGP